MKGFETIVIFAAALSPAAASPPPQTMDSPAYDEPSRAWSSVEDAEARRNCRDHIERARAADGKPELERAPASPDNPILHHAVDRRVDGCGVLVPVGDSGAMLPIPEAGRPEVVPAVPDN